MNIGDDKAREPRFLTPLKILGTQSIRRQVLVFAGFLLLPIVIGAAWSSNRTRNERRAEVEAEAAVLAATSAASVDGLLRGLDSVAAVLARHPALTAPDREECNQLFADLMKVQPLILNVVVRARDGTLQCSGLPGRGVSQRTPIPSVENKVLSSGQPVVSDLTIDAEAQKPTVIMAYPVRAASGAVVGVLDFGIDLSRVPTLFARIPLPEGSVITLTDRQGLILSRSHDAERFIGTTMPRGDGGEPPTVPARDLDGVERLQAMMMVDRAGWVVTVGIPRSEVWDRSWPLFRRNIAITSIAVLGSLLLSLGDRQAPVAASSASFARARAASPKAICRRLRPWSAR